MGNGWGNFLFHTNSSGVVSAGVTNNSDSRIDSAADVLVVDEWQHFAFTLNDRHAKLYRNGELLGEKTNSWRLESSLGHFEIGKAGASTIDGHIDEVRIWSTARTQQEIRDNMHNVLLGNETGLIREWPTRWGGDSYRTEPLECTGRVPWISLHEAVSRAGKEAGSPGQQGASGAWANRGIVIRSWQAQLGGKPAVPWFAERGVKARGEDTSTADILPPPDVTRLESGDFVQATIEHVIVPQYAADYYGPNEALRRALAAGENTWRMIHREAVGNDRRVEIKIGALESLHPAVCVRTAIDAAEFTLTGGLGYVPITFAGLTSPCSYALSIDNQPVNQAVHGNDFWQADYDPAAKRWSQTYNIPVGGDTPHTIRLEKNP